MISRPVTSKESNITDSRTAKRDLEVPDLRRSDDGSGDHVASTGAQSNAVDADQFGRHQVGRRRRDERPGVGHLLLLLLLLAGEQDAVHLVAGHTRSIRRRARKTLCQLVLTSSQLPLLLVQQLALLLEQHLLLMMKEASVQCRHRVNRRRLHTHTTVPQLPAASLRRLYYQEGRALWRKEPPRDATFAHTSIVFRIPHKIWRCFPRVRSMSSVESQVPGLISHDVSFGEH